MADNGKKYGAGTYLLGTAFICTVIAMVLYIINAKGSYYHDFGMKVPWITIGCMGLEILIFATTLHFGENTVIDVIYPVVSVLLMVAAVSFISGRVESAGVILGSDLEASNKEAMSALLQAFAGIGFYVLSMLLVSVSGGFSIKKDRKQDGSLKINEEA